MNSNEAGITFAISYTFCIYFFILKNNLFYIITAMPLCLAVLLTGSKKGVIILLISSIVLIIFKNNVGTNLFYRGIIVVIALALCLITVIRFVPNLYNIIGVRFIQFYEGIKNWNPSGVSRGSKSTALRMSLIRFGIEGILKKPILGYGLDNYRHFSPLELYSHADIIEILFNLGIIGGILYYWPFITLIRIFKNHRDYLDGISKAFILGFIAYYLFLSLTCVTNNSLFNWIILEIMISFMIIKYKQARHKIIQDI
ncbi:MAG: O-antigen ligase family protein [Lachnospiraceae bacterium]|nr:O-antigen ligase family protein [Lachnospiraceae bacterium]